MLFYLDCGCALLIGMAIWGLRIPELSVRFWRRILASTALALAVLSLIAAIALQYYDFIWYPRHFGNPMPFYDYWEMKWIGWTWLLTLPGLLLALFGRGRVRICLFAANLFLLLLAFAAAMGQ